MWARSAGYQLELMLTLLIRKSSIRTFCAHKTVARLHSQTIANMQCLGMRPWPFASIPSGRGFFCRSCAKHLELLETRLLMFDILFRVIVKFETQVQSHRCAE